MVWPLAATAVVLFPGPVQGPGRMHVSHDAAVVGAWDYDPRSLQIILSDRAREELARDGAIGKEKLLRGRGSLQEMFGRMHVEFRPDHRFLLTGERGHVVAEGVWATRGAAVVLSADRPDLHMMDMRLCASGKQIVARQPNPAFGTTQINLIRK